MKVSSLSVRASGSENLAVVRSAWQTDGGPLCGQQLSIDLNTIDKLETEESSFIAFFIPRLTREKNNKSE